MKRSGLSTILLCTVFGLLTLFIGLQYNWLAQASEAERGQMQKRVETDTKALADDFNREIQGAFLNFQVDPSAWKTGNYAEFNERYDHWKTQTAYPTLIKQIVYLNKDAAPLAYSVDKRTFEPIEPTEELKQIQAAEESGERQTVLDDRLALVMPLHPTGEKVERIMIRTTVGPEAEKMQMPKPDGYLVVFLDRTTILEKVMPELKAKYFSGGEYKLTVKDRKANIVFGDPSAMSPDTSATLFDLTPDNLIFFSKIGIPRQPGEKKEGLVVNQRIESRTFSTSEIANGEKTGNLTVEMRENRDGRVHHATIADTTAGGDSWKLSVTHSAGSIDAYVTGERRKSMAIGIGLYTLLVGSIGAIVLSAMRSRRFAQRQIDFVSSVSHEFRTPLAVIYTAGENLADGVTKDETQIARYGNLIKGEGKKLSTMVEQILEFAGARSGKRKYNIEPVNLADVIDHAISECRPLIDEKEIVLETDIAAILPTINADQAALSQAIQNLIANSIKYCNGERWISLSATNGGGALKIVVEDKGIGISSGDMRQIFEPFYRSKDVVDAQIHGNGLGLALVKDIVEAHGGRVSAESEPGKGSKFTIEIPLETN
jgi:signal transduction histidine kinase